MKKCTIGLFSKIITFLVFAVIFIPLTGIALYFAFIYPQTHHEDSSDLGQISGDSTIRRINIDDANDLENTLYFELAVKDKNGKESVYQLQMSLTEITQNHSN